MIKIDIDKKDLVDLFDNFKGKKDNTYKKGYAIQLIKFKDFREIFCNDFKDTSGNYKIDFGEDEIKIKIKNNYLKLYDNYLKLYDNISSKGTAKIYIEIRKFIIEKFTEKIKFCPYCGKVPLIYFEKGKDKENSYKRMFQFDHFFPKNHFHKGIINFYNLIPSCNACNHLKLEENPLDVLKKGGEIFHPYFGWIYKDGEEIKVESDDFDSKVTFYGKSENDKYKYKREQIFNTQHSKFFKLGQKYLNSQDTFNIFNFIQDKRTKMKNELNNFKIDIKDPKEKKYRVEKYKNFFFKNYYPENEQDILKFSNGKLKKDLIENLEI